MDMEEGGDTKRKMELFPQALADLQALQDVLFELQSVQDKFSFAKTEEKGPLDTSAKQAPGGSLSPPRNSEQTVGKASSYRPTVSNVPPGGDPTVAPGAGSVSPSASCWHFCSSPCYSGSLICLNFWSKASNLQKGHKNGD